MEQTLSWSWPEGTVHAGLRRLYADLLAARRAWPALRDFAQRAARLVPSEEGRVLELVRGRYGDAPDRILHAYFNLTGHRQHLSDGLDLKRKVLFSSEAARYRGERTAAVSGRTLLPYECVVCGPDGLETFV